MEPNIAVIGTVFIDCKGFADKRYNPFGRNLGNVKFVHGGVGRNVAENLAHLNLPVSFVSTVDNSALGKEVVNRLRKANVNLGFLSFAESKGIGMWLAVLDQKGDLVGSISQMPDLGLMERLIDEKGRQIVETASHVVLEIDLNERISRTVIDYAGKFDKKVYGIPGNLEVILNNRDFLCYTDCFICNDVEAGRLIGTDLGGMEIKGLLNVLERYVMEADIPSMVITLGERGSVYYDSRTREKGYQPALKTEVVDSSGAGDAFFSGTVMGLVRGRPLSEAVVYGTRVASWTLQAEENNCLEMAVKLREEEFFSGMLMSVG